MKLSTTAIIIPAAVSSMSAVPVPASKAGKNASKSKGFKKGGKTVSLPPSLSSPTDILEPAELKECCPCKGGQIAGCSDLADYCEITSTFDLASQCR